MKLYELKRGTLFRLLEDTKSPPDLSGYPRGQEFRLGNIDGMYSYCTDQYGRVHHPAAWAEVEIIGESN